MKKIKSKKTAKELWKKIPSIFHKMSKGKKTYVALWAITGILLFTMIGLFISKKENYGGNIKTHQKNYSRYLKIIKTVPDSVIEKNQITENNYYVQANSNAYYDWNKDGKYDKDHDIVPNVFYPLSTAKRVPIVFDSPLFNFTKNHFHRKGYGWATIPVKKDIKITLKGSDGVEYKQSYLAGDMIELKKVYDAKEYNPEKGNVAQGDVAEYLSNFELSAIQWNARTQIKGNAPFNEVQGWQVFDVERKIDRDKSFPKGSFLDRQAFQTSQIYFPPSDSAIRTINLLNAFGLIFLIALTSSIFTTVIVSIYNNKKPKERNK